MISLDLYIKGLIFAPGAFSSGAGAVGRLGSSCREAMALARTRARSRGSAWSRDPFPHTIDPSRTAVEVEVYDSSTITCVIFRQARGQKKPKYDIGCHTLTASYVTSDRTD